MTTALDLFAGPGGWSQACRALGISEVGVEIDPDAVATARAAGHERIQADVRRYVPDRRYDGLIASPPCQTFSLAGSGSGRRSLARLLDAVPRVARGVPIGEALGVDLTEVAWDVDGALFDLPADEVLDERSALVLEPMRYIVEHEPTWVALEQVPGVVPVWDAYAASLMVRGYSTSVSVLSAERYGVPQTRRRAILLAHRDRPVEMPTPTHSRYYVEAPNRLDPDLLPWVSMATALGWGMTSRPYVSVAAGTAAGGTDPQMLGGSGARATVRRELDGGRWIDRDQVIYQSGNQENATERPLDHPAPTVAFGHAAADSRWVMRGSGNVGGSADRDAALPAPTLTGKGTAVWRVNDQSGTPRDENWPYVRPATTVAGRDLVADPGANANRFNGATKSRNDGVRVSVSDAGVLQSFPPEYPWQGSRTSQHQQVGDAIPPLLALAILEALT